MLDIHDITFSYRRGANVLQDFTFQINQGGIYGLLGRNGAGKSTLLYLIAGLLTPKNGHVEFDGHRTRERLPETLSEIFIVPEEFELPSITLERFVELNADLYPRFDKEAMTRYLEMFQLPTSLNLGALSMGQKKKAYMSFALACNTRLLLMDEPSNGLDIPGKSAFRRVIGAAASDDRIIIISTHQVRDIDRILDHILIMNNRGIILDASVAEILERLSFRTTSNPAETADALYALPSLEGSAIVERNLDGVDTNLNLETLFGFALEAPDRIQEIFNGEQSGKSASIPPIPPLKDC